MNYEKSCGAVIYTVVNGKRLYLVEIMQKGHTSFCKGHVEENESEHQTAAREIREETGLEVKFVEGFRQTIEYSPYRDCSKTVVFFFGVCGQYKGNGSRGRGQGNRVASL